MSDETTKGCACVSHDAGECARLRYRRDYRSVETDPCDCACHEDDDADYDGDDECESVFGGKFCFLPNGHPGDHVNQKCDGTCDTCECVEWTDADAEDDRSEDEDDEVDDFDELDADDPRSGNWVP